jgi:putative addiction module killer protein
VEVRPRILRNYLTADGVDPFHSWIRAIRDGAVKSIVRTRLNRVGQGNLGDCEPVGEGVYELRIDFGPGYRIYFGEDGDEVILLGGGTKNTQASDIKKAKERWSDYTA